jgi:hypothetical protein
MRPASPLRAGESENKKEQMGPQIKITAVANILISLPFAVRCRPLFVREDQERGQVKKKIKRPHEP